MVEFRMLGALDLRRMTGDAFQAVRLQPKRLALLAYLSLAAPSGFCRRDTLLALFWPESDEEHARNALNQAVHEIRRALGKEVLLSHGAEGLGLSSEVFWCDAVAFEQALERGAYADALDLYRGRLLDGVHVGEALDFEHWLETERERILRRACEAANRLAEQEESQGNTVGAARWLRRLLDLEPDHETALRRLLTLLDQAGDRAGALRAYQTVARRLQQELDLAPSQETQTLVARIRDAAPGPAIPLDEVRPSIAVLPFENLSADPEQAYFCDGITEEIINVLSCLHGLRIAARTSVFAFKHQHADIREIGQKLNVETVLEGSVRKAGRRLRITAQFINVADGYPLWSQRYDRQLEDVFAIQDEIARAIADKLKVELLGEHRNELVQQPTEHLEAYTLYLKGLFYLNKRTPAALQSACTYFQRAIDVDMAYADAYAALAFCYALGGWFVYDVFPPGKAYPLARTAIEKALSLNDRLPEAYVTLAVVRIAFEGRWSEGEQAIQKALALNPNSAHANGQHASYLMLSGRFEEALAAARRAEALDPLALIPKVFIGLCSLLARRYEEAVVQFEQTLDMEPRFFLAHLFLGDVYRFMSRFEEAGASYHNVLDLLGRQPIVLGRLGALYATWNRRTEALQIVSELQALSAQRHVLPTIIAGIYIALKDYDEMFVWLEKACDVKDTQLSMLKVWPAYDPVRSDTRFQILLEKVGLAE